MSAISRGGDFEQAVTASCDRFVPAHILDEDARARQRRLVGVVLAAPFLLAAAAATTFAGHGAVTLLAAICALFAASWSIALLVAATGRARLAGRVALAAGGLVAALMIAAAGGIASPVAVLAVALPVEAFWVERRRGAAGWGALAMLAALVLQVPIAAIAGWGAAEAVSPWHWAAPLAYAALLVARLPLAIWTADAPAARDEAFDMEAALSAAVLRITLNGDVEDASARTEEILGVQPELLLGRGLFERLRIPDRVTYRCALADLAEGEGSRSIEVMLRLPGGPDRENGHRLFQIEMAAAPGGAVAILRPADELAALRAELAEAREAAGSTEVAKGRFLASVSHELRTPLNAIIGFSDLMLHEDISGPLEDKQKEQLGIIRDAGRHLLSVVNSILDISKLEAGTYRLHPEPFPFEAAAALCQSMLEPQARAKQISVTRRIAAGLGQVRCDQRAVQQILINLLSNAIKFTPEGGRVTLEAVHEEGRLAIRVSDTGIGMSDEELARIGRPFTQLGNDYTRQYEGAGLGLCLVRGLVELHGGAMSIESAPGLGTAVTVTLPQDQATTKRADGEADIGAGTKEEEVGIVGEGHETLRRIA